VAKVLRNSLTPEITSGKEAVKLKGVGKESGIKIQEFIDTGEVSKLKEYQEHPLWLEYQEQLKG
jgi:DNA polymerase/3'-5' exonuclease PolX